MYRYNVTKSTRANSPVCMTPSERVIMATMLP